MPQGEGTYGSTVGRPKSLLPKRIIANPATAEEIKTTNRNAKMITTLLVGAAVPLPFRMLGNAGKGFLSGMGFKAIGQTFKKAGTAGNKKGADTVGNRIKQTEAIIGKKRFDKTRIANQYQGTEHGTHGALLGYKAGNAKTSISKIEHDGLIKKAYGTFQERKTDRIIKNAVEQGPAKFFINRLARKILKNGK